MYLNDGGTADLVTGVRLIATYDVFELVMKKKTLL